FSGRSRIARRGDRAHGFGRNGRIHHGDRCGRHRHRTDCCMLERRPKWLLWTHGRSIRSVVVRAPRTVVTALGTLVRTGIMDRAYDASTDDGARRLRHLAAADFT